MFKYFEHLGDRWPKHPSPWKESDASSFEDVIDRIKDDRRIYDCDNGGERVYYIAITDGIDKKYYQLDHEFYGYWYDIEETGETEFEVDNNFELTEISKEEAHIPDDRDWLNVSEFNFKLKKWPPTND